MHPRMKHDIFTILRTFCGSHLSSIKPCSYAGPLWIRLETGALLADWSDVNVGVWELASTVNTFSRVHGGIVKQCGHASCSSCQNKPLTVSINGTGRRGSGEGPRTHFSIWSLQATNNSIRNETRLIRKRLKICRESVIRKCDGVKVEDGYSDLQSIR